MDIREYIFEILCITTKNHKISKKSQKSQIFLNKTGK